MQTLIVRPEAEQDLAEAFAWYQAQREGLGADLLLAVEAAMQEIRRRGESFPVAHHGVRRALVKRFPYAIFFVPQEGFISIVAILHAKRDPKIWRQRAEG